MKRKRVTVVEWAPTQLTGTRPAGKPALTSSGRRTRMPGSSRSATTARPMVAENVNGIANLLLNRNFA